MRKIDAFAHVLPARYRARLERQLESHLGAAQLAYYREGVFDFDPALSDLDARERALEPFGDLRQVLVLSVPPLEEVGPPEVAADFARAANEEMADLVEKHPDRFAGFAAALPLNAVDACLSEMRRAAGELHALGFLLYTNVNGRPLDDPAFDPLWSEAERLDRPFWLHPTRSAEWADYPTERRSDFGLWWSLGWPYETAAALSRLVYSGRMEAHPDLKLIAHHGAGLVPHFAARLAMGPGHRQVKDTLPRPPVEYFRRFYADTALFGAAHAVRCVIDFFGPDHVLFGTDMPLGPPTATADTIADLESLELPEADRAAIYSGNARRLLKLG